MLFYIRVPLHINIIGELQVRQNGEIKNPWPDPNAQYTHNNDNIITRFSNE